MQNNNYPELISLMDTLGLGKDPSLDLLNGIYRELTSINLHFRDTIGYDQVDAYLHFTKKEGTSEYMFTHWDLKVQNQEQQLPLKQTFSIFGKSDSVTLMEGYHLLQGRSIYKTLYSETGEKLPSWCSLDFKNTEPDGNFAVKLLGNQYNLEASVHKYPIKELQKEMEKKWLIQALEEGRRVQVTVQNEDKENKVYVEAAPKFNSIKFYDLNHRPIAISKELQRNQSLAKKVRQAEDSAIRPAKLRL